MRFATKQDRLNHPQAGTIPEALWANRMYFSSTLDEINLYYFTTPLETIFKEKVYLRLTENEQRCAIFALLSRADKTNLTTIINHTCNFEMYNLQMQFWDVYFTCLYQLQTPELSKALRSHIDSGDSRKWASQLWEMMERQATPEEVEQLQFMKDQLMEIDFKSYAYRSASYFAAEFGDIEMLEWVDRIKPGFYYGDQRLIATAASYNQLKTLIWLQDLNPKKLSVKILDSSINNPINTVIEKGFLEMLQYLYQNAPHLVSSWNYHLKQSARYGHEKQTMWIMEQCGTSLQTVVQDQNYDAFRGMALSGSIESMEYLIERFPKLKNEMFASQNFEAIRQAMLYNSLEKVLWFKNYVDEKTFHHALEKYCSVGVISSKDVAIKEWYFKTLGVERIEQLIRAEKFEVVQHGCNVETLKCIQKKCSKEFFIELITADNYRLFYQFIRFDKIDTLQWLKEHISDELFLTMLQHDNNLAWRHCIDESHFDMIKWFYGLYPKLQDGLLKSYYEPHFYGSFSSHGDYELDVYKWLRELDVELFETTMLDDRKSNFYEHIWHAFIDGTHSNLFYYLLSSPNFFAREAKDYSKTTKSGGWVMQFVTDKVQTLDEVCVKQEAKLYRKISDFLTQHYPWKYAKTIETLNQILKGDVSRNSMFYTKSDNATTDVVVKNTM